MGFSAPTSAGREGSGAGAVFWGGAAGAGSSGLGDALAVKGKLEEAVACYRHAILHDPKILVAYTNLGNTLARQGKVDEAVACVRQKALDELKF